MRYIRRGWTDPANTDRPQLAQTTSKSVKVAQMSFCDIHNTNLNGKHCWEWQIKLRKIWFSFADPYTVILYILSSVILYMKLIVPVIHSSLILKTVSIAPSCRAWKLRLLLGKLKWWQCSHTQSLQFSVSRSQARHRTTKLQVKLLKSYVILFVPIWKHVVKSAVYLAHPKIKHHLKLKHQNLLLLEYTVKKHQQAKILMSQEWMGDPRLQVREQDGH